RADLAAVFANPTPVYYDVWALRHPVWCPNDCWQEARLHSGAMGANLAVQVFVASRQVHIDPAAPPFRVNSAFGGLGIYRLSDALTGRYQGIEVDGNLVCEHVPFHRSIAERTGHGFEILPSLLVAAPAAHLN